MSEILLQQKIWIWFFNNYPEHRISKNTCLLVHHFNNPRNAIQGAGLKTCGLTKGIPDFILYVPANGYHGLFLELKEGKNTTSKEQKEVLSKLQEKGYFTAICYDFETAVDVIKNYLNGTS